MLPWYFRLVLSAGGHPPESTDLASIVDESVGVEIRAPGACGFADHIARFWSIATVSKSALLICEAASGGRSRNPRRIEVRSLVSARQTFAAQSTTAGGRIFVVKRRAFSLLAAMSLALCLAVAGFWSRSYR